MADSRFVPYFTVGPAAKCTRDVPLVLRLLQRALSAVGRAGLRGRRFEFLRPDIGLDPMDGDRDRGAPSAACCAASVTSERGLPLCDRTRSSERPVVADDFITRSSTQLLSVQLADLSSLNGS